MNGEVSSEQAAAIHHGNGSKATWEPVVLPRKSPEYPSKFLGMHIEWAEGYSNSPRLKLKCAEDPLAFSNAGKPAWHKKGPKTWIAEKGGVASVHYHDGPVALREFQKFVRWDTPDGKCTANAKAIYEPYYMQATTKQDGYAGRVFDITMAADSDVYPGETVRLQGPWHGGAPEGYEEVSYLIWDDKTKAYAKSNPWYFQGGYFGLYVQRQVLLAIAAQMMPHIEWGLVTYSYGTYLQPLRSETGRPKGFYVAPSNCPGHIIRGNGPHGKEQSWDRCIHCNLTRKQIEEGSPE